MLAQYGFLGAKSNNEYTILFPLSYTTVVCGFRNVGCDSGGSYNAKEGSLHHVELSSAKTQINSDHNYAAWFTIGY